METIITEWNTIIRLKENLWLKIEEPRDETHPTECNITVHYKDPNTDKDDEPADDLNIEYQFHQEQYDEMIESEDEDDDE